MVTFPTKVFVITVKLYGNIIFRRQGSSLIEIYIYIVNVRWLEKNNPNNSAVLQKTEGLTGLVWRFPISLADNCDLI